MDARAVKSPSDPTFNADDLRALLARHIDASRRGAFDGNEHPENADAVNAVMSALWPVATLDSLAAALRVHCGARSAATELYRTHDITLPPGEQFRITGSDGRVVFVYAGQAGRTCTSVDNSVRLHRVLFQLRQRWYRFTSTMFGKTENYDG